MVRLGILGTARIARAFFQSPLDGVIIEAVASRSQQAAESFGDAFALPKRYGSYSELISDPAINAVYIPLPQHLHLEFVAECAKAGKHVLIEKPPALSSPEVDEMEAVCGRSNVWYMEALMYRFMRFPNRIREIIESGEIGSLRHIDFHFCFDIASRGLTGFRLDRKLGGGALYDLGIYGADFLRFITGTEPEVLDVRMRRDGGDGIDLFTHAFIRFGDVTATMTIAFDHDANFINLAGDKGRIYAPVAISGRLIPNELHIHNMVENTTRIEYFPSEDPYKFEIEYFARCIANNEPPFLSWNNSRNNLRFLEQIFALAKPIREI